VFGACNVTKMLLRVPVVLCQDAANTVCYEVTEHCSGLNNPMNCLQLTYTKVASNRPQ
jgi:hypothetical protein